MDRKNNWIRIELFKNLVKKCNYNVFVLEDNYSLCKLINNYLHKGEGIPKDLFLKLMFPWRSILMLNFLKWIN